MNSLNIQLAVLAMITAIAMILPGTQHSPREIFVATNGNDAGPGTSDSPYRSIQHAADSARPGETVTVRAGAYDEILRFTRSGNYFDRTITVQAAAGEQVVLKGIETAGQDHLTVRGLTVRGAAYLGISVAGSYRVRVENCRTEGTPGSGIWVDKSHDVVVSRCDVSGACSRGGEESVSIKRSAEVTFEDSDVHNTFHEGIDVKEGSRDVVVRRNRVSHVERQGLYADGWDADTGNIRFEHNVVFDCMVGLVACTEAGGLLHDVTFAGNVVYDCRGPGMMVAKWGSGSHNHRIQNVSYLNNTVVHCGGLLHGHSWAGGMLMENDQAENVVVVNNIFSDNGYAQFRVTLGLPPKGIVEHNNLIDGPGENITEHNLKSAVKFVNAAQKDYRLAPGSPGIHAGALVPGLCETDAAGLPRTHNGRIDIGAFETQ